MEKLLHCPVCTGSSFEDRLECRDYTVSQSVFSIQACGSCGFLFTNPRPEKEEIGAYYQSADYISHTNSSKGLFNRVYQTVRNRAIRQKIALIQGFFDAAPTLRLLDVGCGTGEFLSGVEKAGWKAIGVEPSEAAAEQARKNHGVTVHPEEWLENTTEKFDVISLWHVLEHVHDLDARLKQLHRILNDKGLLVIAVPNHTSADASRFKEHWAAWDVPRHLYHFSPATIKQLLTRYGFKHIQSRPMVFDAYYVSLLSTGYQSGKKSHVKGFLAGWGSNRAAKGDPERYSSVIYLFKKSL